MFAGKKSAQIREILISESAWEEMTCLFAPSLTRHINDLIDFPYSYLKTQDVINEEMPFTDCQIFSSPTRF
ncbi:hypothetical protein CAH63_18760 [Salmonella enterica subsp. enterica serovar Typhimurium]|nr:hypothetical protein [Salmonella enterica subsp. enterica serovar Typhimurium]EBG7450260.1 hypothetical protein [Salmonella enterica]EBO2395689.1 hypothetical protein [Salmonella enterica subsp. enterica serovar Typhimurium]ECH1763352.1 hypothetical protein [Salmonella enterica]EDC5712428.1 hypothetical protein [Salmonella enterica]